MTQEITSSEDDDQPGNGAKHYTLNHDGICRCTFCTQKALETVLTFGLGKRNHRIEQRALRQNPQVTQHELSALIHNRVLGELKAFRAN